MEWRPRLVPRLLEPQHPVRRQPRARSGRDESGDQRDGGSAGVTEGRHTARLVLTGHIIDSMMLPQVMDLVMDEGGNFTIEELKVGQHKTDTSLCRMEIIASSAEQLDRIVRHARALGATAEAEEPAQLGQPATLGTAHDRRA